MTHKQPPAEAARLNAVLQYLRENGGIKDGLTTLRIAFPDVNDEELSDVVETYWHQARKELPY